MNERNSAHDVELVASINKDMPTYSTRKMKHEFIEHYSQIPGLKQAILRNIYSYLTGDASAANSTAEKAVNTRVLVLAGADDPDLFWDLRILNGRPQDERFNSVWDQLAWKKREQYMNEDMVSTCTFQWPSQLKTYATLSKNAYL